jgi:hypothetical protein
LKDVVFDSPEVRETIDMIKELAQYAPPDATSWANVETVNGLTSGYVGMACYSGRVFSQAVNPNPAYNAALVGKFANAIVPYNKAPAIWGGIGTHGLFKGKNQQGAKELAKFSLRKEQVISYMLVTPGTYSPAIPAYADDPSYTGSAVLKQYDPKTVATITEAAKYGVDFLKEGPGWKTNPKSGALSGSLFLVDIVQKVTVGKGSTQSAVTFGTSTIGDVMKG